MEVYDKVLSELNVPTNHLKMDIIQDILKLAKQKTTDNTTEYWSHIADMLWDHLHKGFTRFDDQLLSATCFFTAVPLTDKQDLYLKVLQRLIEEELSIRICGEKSDKTVVIVSMMYGIFQSTFLNQNTYKDVSNIHSIVKSIFDILLQLGYEYSQFTFISFKIMKLFSKVCGTELEDCIFNNKNQISLLNFVNHNWENPVTGVRDLNRSIFKTIISTLDDDTYNVVLKEINSFYWNKAKYLMLSEVVEHQKVHIQSLIHENKWVDGLIYSLHKPGLVSAGADMYYAILKQINFDHDWRDIFLQQIVKTLNGESSKAIENFNNFWCLPTMKKFPEVFNTLIDELNKSEETEQNLCSKLCIIKQANRLSLVEKVWDSTKLNEIETIVLKGIEHCNYYMRMSAFDIVCVSPKKVVITKREYDLILDFLYSNVNSDCTVLRLSLLNSFNIFLTQLHTIFLNEMIKYGKSEDLELLLEFCKRLQYFITTSINSNGNYQRKITCVKLCNLILTCFSEIPRKKKGQARRAQMALIDYVKENNCWLLSNKNFVIKLVSLLKDPTDDVRENVIKLLLNYYSSELKEPNIMTDLVNDALQCTRSKFFYEISCGQSIFKLLTNLVIKDKHSIVEYGSVEDIFNFAYKELIVEYKAKTNVMESIETGKQLHSIMSILLVVLETCLSCSYKIDINSLSPEFIEALETISNQFGWEEESTSSDFSKMNEMVENIIADSGYTLDNDNDLTKISGLHQIVLNCLWLNVKVSCDLASILVQYNVQDAETCEKCLNIITHVLETSRHKGAIEAAGAALGRALQFLTSLPEDNKISEVPFQLLQCKLNDLISETNRMASITRRGAGLSIMVHRIVSSDMKKGKPLFHHFIKTLLQICNTTKGSPIANDENKENQIDLPKAIYIHFLTRVVADSSLASDMMFYFAKLAELAFGNLTSPHWQIRNAALQLYGALIPKLIGEKKASGTDEETTATVACDELRTHSPKLWAYIMAQLEQTKGLDQIQSHSNLVPILNLLANSAKRYNFSYDMSEQCTEDERLVKNLVSLLQSPIYTVRRLTAKCIFNIYDFGKIIDLLSRQVIETENFLHGSLLLLNTCNKYYYSNPVFKKMLLCLGDKYRKIFSERYHSYLSKTLFEGIFVNNITLEDVQSTLQELNSNIHSPGVHLWAEARIQLCINTCLWTEIPVLLKVLLQESDYENYCKLFALKLLNQNNLPREILLEVANVLVSFRRYSSSTVWEILYEISLLTDLSGHIVLEEVLKNIEKGELTYILRYTIPLAARNISMANSEAQESLIKLIDKLSDFETSDVDMRCIAALANNELAIHIDKLSNSTKVICLKCAIMLLQDEDEDVRNLSVKFYTRISEQIEDIQPYICLSNILKRQFLLHIFGGCESSIEELTKALFQILQSNRKIEDYNPFSNDSKNIYLEPEVLMQIINNL